MAGECAKEEVVRQIFPNVNHSGRKSSSLGSLNVFGDRYAGAFLRVQPKSAADVVNLTQHATQGAIVDV